MGTDREMWLGSKGQVLGSASGSRPHGDAEGPWVGCTVERSLLGRNLRSYGGNQNAVGSPLKFLRTSRGRQ